MASKATTAPRRQTVKTRFIILSDTHTRIPFNADDATHAYRSPLPDADVLLHAGDLTMCGNYDEHQKTFSMLADHPAPLKIVVPGNHDITLDEPYYTTHGWRHSKSESPADVHEIYMGSAAKKAGVVLMKEGAQSFQLENGAQCTVYASAYQPEFCDWAFAYERDEDRFNPGADHPVPSHPDIDVMVTHGPPHGILDQVVGFGSKMSSSVGCEHLRRAVARCRPQLHTFGHIHEGWGAQRMRWGLGDGGSKDELTAVQTKKEEVLHERAAFVDLSSEGNNPLRWGEETLFVNASIMNVRYKPVNAPWIVDLDLPRGS